MAQTVRPLFSNRDLLALIWPLVVEQLLGLTLGMADIIMVGTLGESAVSGVSLVDNIQILLYSLFSALSTGGAVVCSQYIGKNRQDLSSKTAKQLIYTVFLLAAAIAAIGLLGRHKILSLIFGKIEADVMKEAQTYFAVMMFAMPSMGIYSACAALFRAQGNSRISMYISVMINIMNIIGNYIGIFILHLGVFGAAVATLLSRTAAAIILFVQLYRGKTDSDLGGAKVNAISLRGILKVKLDARIIKHILGIGIPNGVENSMFQIGRLVVLSLISSFGTSAIAANAAANTIAGFATLPGMAIGLAMLTVIGRCAGAGRLEEAKTFTWKLMRVTYASMFAMNVLILLLAQKIISIYNLQPATAELAWNMLLWHGIFCMLVWPLAFTIPNSLRALNDAKFTMVVSMLSMWFIRIGLSYVLAWTTDLGAMCTWVAMVADWIVRAIAFTIRFRHEKWKAKATL